MNTMRSVFVLWIVASPVWVLAADDATQSPRYTAMVTISELKDGKPVTLAAPKLLLAACQKGEIQVGDDACSIQVTVESVTDKSAVAHVVQAKIITAPRSKNPAVVASPRLRLHGKTGTIHCRNIAIEAAFEPAQ